MTNNMRAKVRLVAALLLLTAGMFCRATAAGIAPERILRIKSRVTTKGNSVLLRDLVNNPAVLTPEEAEYEVMKTPAENDVNMTIVDIAYMLQRYPSLLNVQLKGERQITFKRVSDMRILDDAKRMMVAYLKSNQPWKEWEIDVVFSANDESLICRTGDFKRLEAVPTDNRSMIGTVDFRVSFYDVQDRLLSRINLSPKIMCRADAFVMRESRPKGDVIAAADLKKVPVWLGDEKKGFITDEKMCIGKELAREVSAGDYLRVSDLINPVCARRGEIIWVTSTSGALSVRLAVQAEQNGRLGEVIRVMNRSTQKTFDVELTGPKSAIHRMGS